MRQAESLITNSRRRSMHKAGIQAGSERPFLRGNISCLHAVWLIEEYSAVKAPTKPVCLADPGMLRRLPEAADDETLSCTSERQSWGNLLKFTSILKL